MTRLGIALFIAALLALFHVIPERAGAESGMIVLEIPFDTKFGCVSPSSTGVVVSNFTNNINKNTLSIVRIGILLVQKLKLEALHNWKVSNTIWRDNSNYWYNIINPKNRVIVSICIHDIVYNNWFWSWKFKPIPRVIVLRYAIYIKSLIVVMISECEKHISRHVYGGSFPCVSNISNQIWPEIAPRFSGVVDEVKPHPWPSI